MLRLGITTLAVFIAGCASGPALPGAGGAVQAPPTERIRDIAPHRLSHRASVRSQRGREHGDDL
jgi:hypothetical protein